MKKVYLKVLAAAALIAVFAVQNVSIYAYEVKTSGGNISVTGEAHGRYVNVIIMPVGEDTENLTPDKLIDNRHLAFSCTAADAAISESFGMPPAFVSGEYKALFFDRSKISEKRFVYYNTQLDGFSEELKAAEDKQTLIRENTELLGIAREEAELFGQVVAGLGELKQIYGEAITVLGIKRGGLDAAVEHYGSIYGMDFAEYNALKPEVKKTLQAKLTAEEISDLKTDYQKCLQESIFENLADTDELYALLKKMGADFTIYSKLTETKQSAVLTRMLNNLPERFDDLKVSVFAQYVREAYGDSGSSPGTGGPAGGGSPSGGPAAGSVVINDAPQVKPERTELTDISLHWAKNNILKLYNAGVISGYSDARFCPDNSITRAEFSTLIVKALGISIVNVQKPVFQDVSENDWYAPYVLALSAQGAVSGYDSGSFGPADNITRQDMAVILYNLCAARGLDLQGTADFNDVDLIDSYARDKVVRLAAAGVISGFNGYYNPKARLTRAEAATVIVKLLELVG